MNREIKFRGKRVDNGEWVYGHLNGWVTDGKPVSAIITPEEVFILDPSTVGQYTGLKDKNGKDIYEGDEIQYKTPYRTTQTHTGDNIPNGSYTEPMEPGIKTIYGIVRFLEGAFILGYEDGIKDFTTPLSWHQTQWDLDSIKLAISWTRQYAGWFDDPEEGDLQYLITECARVENSDKLIDYLNGFEIIGNVFDNPELLNK